MRFLAASEFGTPVDVAFETIFVHQDLFCNSETEALLVRWQWDWTPAGTMIDEGQASDEGKVVELVCALPFSCCAGVEGLAASLTQN